MNLSENRLFDLTPLSGLTRMTELFLSDNRIADISPLRSLTRVRVLSLGRNRITRITPLLDMRRLRSVVVERNPLDLAPGSESQLVIASLRQRRVAVDDSPIG